MPTYMEPLALLRCLYSGKDLHDYLPPVADISLLALTDKCSMDNGRKTRTRTSATLRPFGNSLLVIPFRRAERTRHPQRGQDGGRTHESPDSCCKSTYISIITIHTSTVGVWLPRQKCGPILPAPASGKTPSGVEREKEEK